jgi:hypothetical protein
MVLPSSGNPISLYQIKDEADGGGQNNSVPTTSAFAMNDSNIRALIGKANEASNSFSEYYGVSGDGIDPWPLVGPTGVPSSTTAVYTNASYALAGINYAQQQSTSNAYIIHRWSSFNSGSATTYSYAYQDYDGLGSATFQAKAVYSVTYSKDGTVTGSVQNPTSGSPATNTWTNVSTSSYSPIWQWAVEAGGSSGTQKLDGTVTFYGRANDSGTYYPNSTGYNSGQKTIFIRATRGTQGPSICLHYNMKVQLEDLSFVNVNNVSVGDMIRTAAGFTEVLEVVTEHEREGYYLIDNGLMITNDHPFKVGDDWVVPEYYTGTKEYVEGTLNTVYIETAAGEFITYSADESQNWTVSGNYASCNACYKVLDSEGNTHYVQGTPYEKGTAERDIEQQRLQDEFPV